MLLGLETPKRSVKSAKFHYIGALGALEAKNYSLVVLCQLFTGNINFGAVEFKSAKGFSGKKRE